MSNRGISTSGRVLRWLLWRAPKGAVLYTFNSNLALAGDLGRRVIVFLVFGAYLWGLRWLAVNYVPPLRVVSALLLLLWFWHGVNLVRWIIHARAQAAQARAMQREMYRTLQGLPGQIQQGIAMAAGAAGRAVEGVDVLGMFKTDDPLAAEQARTRREQSRQVRDMLPDDQRDFPLGDRPEPLISMPRWLRRRRPR